ncbi:MAG: hypothetical protein ACXABG_15970, partial [Promethearchaeota archaeon]
MTEKETESNLLERAQNQEKEHNLFEAAKLYEKAAKSYLDRNLLEEAAIYFKKAGLVCTLAIETVKNSEEFIENGKRGIEVYSIAKRLFLRNEERNMTLECEAEILYIKAFMTDSVIEIKKALNDSYDLFLELSELYHQDGDKEGIIRTLCRSLFILKEYSTYCTTNLELKDVIQKGTKIGEESWNLSMEIENLHYLFITYYGVLASILTWQVFAMDFKNDEQFKKYFEDSLSKFERITELAEGWDDSRVLGYIYFMGGCSYCTYANHYIKDEIEQGEITDKGLDLLEKALKFGKEAKNNYIIIYSIYYLNWWAFFLRRFNYVQKRIARDVDAILSLGKIYANFPNTLHFYASLLPA